MNETWRVLEVAIPRGKAQKLARILNVSHDLILKWRREPVGPETRGTGARNPLDRVLDILDFVFLENPSCAHLLVKTVQDRYEELVATQSLYRPREDRLKTIGAANKELSEAITALIWDRPAVEVRREWEEAKIAAERAVREKEESEAANLEM